MIRPLTQCAKCVHSIPSQITAFRRIPPLLTLLQPNLRKLNLTSTFVKPFHLSGRKHSKLFIDIENSYAYNLLPQVPKFEPSHQAQTNVTTIEDFEQLLDQNWRNSTATDIVSAFERIQQVAITHKIDLSDRRFDKLIDGLMDHCEKLTDEELLRLLLALLEWPPCESSFSHNFHDIWSCLDDVCCWKMSEWNLEKVYTFADIWYRWNLGRMSDFMFEAIDRLTRRPHRLSQNMLLYTFFFLNICRKHPVPFEVEHALAQRIEECSVNDLTVIAMGYFKTKTKIKLVPIVNAMIKAVSENYEEINEISLAAMLKIIRLSQRYETAGEIPSMLDKVVTQIPRLSIMSLVHITLTGTSLQIKHEESIVKCTERILREIDSVRLKDIERFLVACSMFNIDTELYSKAYEEIHKETRRKEFVQYNRCLPSILNYLSLRKIYSPSLTNEVLNDEYINETYGKTGNNVPRDLFSLDTCMEIECPEYKGNRISPTKKYKAAKWQTEYTPTYDQPKRLSLADKAYLDVADSLLAVVGEERLLRHDHVLPHFSKSDIIVCKDSLNGDFVEPKGFQNYILGDVKRPFDLEKYKWFALVIMTPNLTVRDACEPLGAMVMKERQLRAIGYEPIFIYTYIFANLSPPEKLDFLKSQLH